MMIDIIAKILSKSVPLYPIIDFKVLIISMSFSPKKHN